MQHETAIRNINAKIQEILELNLREKNQNYKKIRTLWHLHDMQN